MFSLIAAGLLPLIPCHAATTTVVAYSGMKAPGGSSTNVTFTTFTNPAINDQGTVVFGASVKELLSWPVMMPLAGQVKPVGTGTPVQNIPRITNAWSGIWTVDSRKASSFVTRTGSPYGLMDAGGFSSLEAPLLNNSNISAFAGNYSPGFIMLPPTTIGAAITNFYGGNAVWASSDMSLPAVFVGESAPGYPFPLTTTVGTLSDLANRQSTNGFLFSNPPVTFTNRLSISSIDRIALPDTGGILFSATVGATNSQYPPLPGNPPYVMPMYVAQEPLVQHGIWAQSGTGTLALVAREGENLSVEGTDRTVQSLSFMACTNEAGGQTRSFNPRTGDAVFSAIFTDGGQSLLITSPANGNVTTLAAMSGDPAPGGGTNETFASFGDPAMNSAGHLAFRAEARTVTPFPILYALAPPQSDPATLSQSFTNSWSGIWAQDASGHLNQIARSAPPVPDIGGFTSFSDPVYNASHQVAFLATKRSGFIVQPPGTFQGGTGIWTSANLSTPIAYIGQQAPGYPKPFMITVRSPYAWSTNNITFRGTPPLFSSFDRIALADTGRLIVWGTVSSTNLIPRPPVPRGRIVTQEIRQSVLRQRGIWVQNASGGLDLLAREGGILSVNGTNRMISSIPFFPSTDTAAGQSRSFSQSNGEVVYPAIFTDGSQAIIKVSLP